MSNHWLDKLQMWTNDIDYIVAKTQKDAVRIACKTMGYGEEEECEWYVLSETGNFKFQHDDGMIEEKTVAEWVQWNGEGYFAWSEY